jgi:hypothetical protein
VIFRALALGGGKNLAVSAAFAANLDFRQDEAVRERCSDELHTALWGGQNLLYDGFPHWGASHFGEK